MAAQAKHRILEDNDVRKLVLTPGIPNRLQGFLSVIQETFIIPGDLYQVSDFDGQFFTLTCIEEVQDKGTLKIIQTQPVVLTSG